MFFLHLVHPRELRQPNYFTTRRRRCRCRRHRRCWLGSLVMYSAQPTGADGATINPAALNSGEFFIFFIASHIIPCQRRCPSIPILFIIMSPPPPDLDGTRRLQKKRKEKKTTPNTQFISFFWGFFFAHNRLYPIVSFTMPRAPHASCFSSSLRSADPPTS